MEEINLSQTLIPFAGIILTVTKVAGVSCGFVFVSKGIKFVYESLKGEKIKSYDGIFNQN